MYSYLEPTRGGKEWKKMNFDDIVAKVKECGKKTVAVSVAQDSAVLEAVHEAKRLGIADAILVGDEAKIREIAAGLNMDLSDYEIINEPDMIEASLKAVKLAHDGRADMYMKGLIDSKNFLKSVLNKEVGLRTGGTLSHVCVFEIPGIDRLLFLTDVAFMTYPTLEEKVQIIKNTIPVCNACGVAEPKVAPLAAVEVVNPKMPVTVDAAELTKMCEEGQIPGCIVDGPLSLDLAIDPEAAKHKGATDRKIQGDADVLLFPDIHAGNLVYKAIVHMVPVKNGNILTGTQAPVILTSRSDTCETKVNSIALSSGLIFPSWFRLNILSNIPFIAAPPLIVHVFIVIGFAGKQDIFTIYQSHVTITSVKSFHCQFLHFFEFYVLIFFDGYSVYQ